MVMAGAYAAITGIVGADALVEAMPRIDPVVPHAAHRRQRSARSAPGFDAVERRHVPAWVAAAATGVTN